MPVGGLLGSDFLERDDTRRINKLTKPNLIHDRDQPLANGDKFWMRNLVAATIGKVDAKWPEWDLLSVFSIHRYAFGNNLTIVPAPVSSNRVF
jgi:hypothetical protein